MESRRQITDGIRDFVYAGKAIFTVVNTRTGNRLTFQVKRADKNEGQEVADDVFFVKVLTGPRNTSDYTFLGTVFDAVAGRAVYRRSAKSRIGADAMSARTAAWLVARLEGPGLPEFVEFWHEGRCGKCGLPLTDPVSIAAGKGPKCRKA